MIGPGYPEDPEMRSSTLALLGGIWTRLPAAIARAQGWGVDWTAVSTPFVEQLDGRTVAHVGVLELELELGGRRQLVAGVHAVCTAPDQRKRGHMRAAMERALAWIDEHYATAILWANDPAIYERWGFVARQESLFHGPVVGGSSATLRPLSLELSDDVELLRTRLARRTPVASRIAGADQGWLSLLDLALWAPTPSLAWIPEWDCVVVYKVRDRFLDLFDVIGERVPPLAEIAGRLGPNIEAAVTYFSPEALAAPQLRAEPTTLIDQLMVRGEWPEGPEPFALSPLNRC